MTLRQWQRLAQPHLGGLFERRDGVKNRGERKLDLEGEVYTLSDFEEDGKCKLFNVKNQDCRILPGFRFIKKNVS